MVRRGRHRKGGRRNRETEKRIGRGRRERYRQREERDVIIQRVLMRAA